MMTNNIPQLQQWIYMLLLVFPISLSAQEGTKQISPVATELSGLLLSQSNNYGSYFGAPEENQIKFTINNFSTEKFYFGFSWTNYTSGTAGTTTILNYATNNSFMFYRILDSNGTVVAGPTLLPKTSPFAGQITSYNQAIAGPKIGTLNSNGYTPIIFTPTKNDTYIIEYWRGTSATNSTQVDGLVVSPFFDFSVATSTATIPGRVFATKWGLATTTANTSAQYSTSSSSKGSPKFYIYTDKNNVMTLELPDVKPLGYIIGANNYGITNGGDFANDRKSINNNPDAPALSGGYNIFLNSPDPSVFTINNTIAPPPSFGSPIVSPVSTCNTAPYNINYNVTEAGDYRITIKGSGYTDRILFVYNLQPGSKTIQWDGKDGAGTAILASTSLTFELTAFSDRFNIPLIDIEQNLGGIKVTSVAPASANISNLFWDDSSLTAFNTSSDNGNALGAGTNNSTVGTVSPTHTWTNSSGGSNQYNYFGNARTINTWGYIYHQTVTATSTLLCVDVAVTKTVSNATPAIGDEVSFTLTASNTVSGTTATNVIVNDVLPEGFEFVSATPASGSGTWTAPNWTVGNLVAGTPKSIVIVAKVLANTNYTNVASIRTDNFESNYNNNNSFVKVTPLIGSNEILVTALCDSSTGLTEGFELNNTHIGTAPAGSSLVWFDNANHTGTALSNTLVTTTGDYYAFYYDEAQDCYSPASAKVKVDVPDCFCYQEAVIDTEAGTALDTRLGISALARTGLTSTWPTIRKSGWIVLEAKTKGFVINRVKFNASNLPVATDGTALVITSPVEGMMVFDTTNNCLKMYTTTDGTNFAWFCMETQTCPE